MALLGDTRVVAVEERARDVHARARVTRDLEDQLVTDLQDGLRHHRVPVEPGDREVLTEAARADRMAFHPQRFDRLHREDADRTLRSAVVLVITVAIAFESVYRDLGASDGRLRHASRRHAHLNDPSRHSVTSIPMCWATARLYASRAVARSSSAQPTDLNAVISPSLVRPGHVPVTISASSEIGRETCRGSSYACTGPHKQ